MTNDTLIVDDLLLLLLDDAGKSIAGAGTLHFTLGGAVLAELALREAIELDESSRTLMRGPVVRPLPGATLGEDKVLNDAFAIIAETPQPINELLVKIGGDLRVTVLDRLENRGLIRKEEGRVLGIFRTTSWPAADAEHESMIRQQMREILVDGATPTPRLGTIIGLLSASGAMAAIKPPLPWNPHVASRAKEMETGNWGASAVNDAIVAATTAAVVAATTAAVVASTATVIN